MAWTKNEIQDAKERLREIIKPGDTIFTVLRNVSRSGMTRSIGVYVMVDDDGESRMRCISLLASQAADLGWDRNRHAVKMGGCGMDMGYAIVNDIGYALFPDGFECTGRGKSGYRNRCPSSDHSNGDNDYTSHHHESGEYALRHEWI